VPPLINQAEQPLSQHQLIANSWTRRQRRHRARLPCVIHICVRLSWRVPYRIDISCPPYDALDRLVQLGALDIELVGGGVAAIFPDGVTPEAVACALGVASVAVSPAIGRDSGSVWLLNPRAVRIGSVLVAPPELDAPTGALKLTDSTAFGSGHHPTTALCAEALEDAFSIAVPKSILDVGIGSGMLALTALIKGVPQAVGLDIDADALKIAAEHAGLNKLADRLQFVLGGPDVLDGVWPLVVANVLAAPLIEMAPVLVRRVGRGGRLILSGIPCSLESEVGQAYQRLGMRHIRSAKRAGWSVLIVEASW
jgi:ribosomal protein L11 methyltransferase